MISLVKCDTPSGGVKEEEQSPCLSWSYCFVELSNGESLLLPLSPLLGASQEAEEAGPGPVQSGSVPMVETTSACSLQPQERSRQGQQHYWCPGKEEHEACALPGAFGGEQRAGCGGGRVSFQQVGTRVLCPQRTGQQGGRSEKLQPTGQSHSPRGSRPPVSLRNQRGKERKPPPWS